MSGPARGPRRGVSLIETLVATSIMLTVLLGAGTLLDTAARALAVTRRAEDASALSSALALLWADAAAASEVASPAGSGPLELVRPDGSRSRWSLVAGALGRTPVDARGREGRRRVVARGVTRFRSSLAAPGLLSLEVAAPAPRSWLSRKRWPERRDVVLVALRGAGREGSW